MPYKNREQNKKYQREWIRRKKAGLPTRTTTTLTKDERKNHIKRNKHIYNQKRRTIIEEAFGKECFFCSHKKVSIIHRKDGKKHKILSMMGIGRLNEEITKYKNEYVRVCGICHKAIHWIMKYFKWTWDDVINAI